jgi:hypothetical protein
MSLLESCRRSSDVNFHFWLWAASSTHVRCSALRAAWTISVSSKSLMLRRIGTWNLWVHGRSETCTNLGILLASRICLDARDCDLKFAHPVTRIARADQYRSNVVPQRRPSAPAGQVGGFSCFVLRPNARVSSVQRAAVSSLIRFLPVIPRL